MCSVSGLIDNQLNHVQKENKVRNMMEALYHRGPDSKGIFLDDNLVMGSTRLKIVGLNNGDQPIYNENKEIILVCNGEIFNYLELKLRLKALGHIFSTDTDVEILIHLYEEYKEHFLTHVNGQFAFALYDKGTSSLILGRDKTGICPLFYYYSDNCFYFASEIKALFCLDIRREISFDSLYESLCLWSVPPPNTIFKNVFQVIPGEYIRVSIDSNKLQKIERQRYWNLNFSNLFTGTIQEASQQLRKTLIDSVNRALVADVPVGLYLSGGVDSSILACIISKILGKKIDTFSIEFEDQSLDESSYQRLIIDEIKSNHHKVHCQNSDIAKAFPKVVQHAETVLFRCAPVPLHILSNLVHQNKYKAVLSGEGSDEIFLGYDTFRELNIRLFWSKNPDSNLRPLLLQKIFQYYSQFKDSRYFEFVKAFYKKDLLQTDSLFYSHLPRWETNKSLTSFLLKDRLSELSISSHTERMQRNMPVSYYSWNHFQRAQYLEMITLLNGYLLSSQGDRMLMSNSVEGRFPFLDSELINFASSLPTNFKCKGLKDKYILREAFKDIIPLEIYTRGKFAYRAPDFKSFYQNELIEDYIHEIMSVDFTKKVGIFDPDKVRFLHDKGLKKSFQNITNTDNMAINTILSTHLLYYYFIKE